MSNGFRRRLANLACHALQMILPPSLRTWGRAVRCETADISDDTKALLFALDSLCGLVPRAVASRLFQFLASLTGHGIPFSGDPTTMNVYQTLSRRPRAVGISSLFGAVMLGLAYLWSAGAPVRYLGINLGALAIGLTILAMPRHLGALGRRWPSGAIMAMGCALLATALLGARIEGAARWVNLGGLAVQTSLILLPAMLVAFSQTRTVPATIGIAIAAVAMALQPDRAMAGMLALGLAAVAMTSPEKHVVAALAVAVIGFGATLIAPDALPAVPFVDQILYTSFHIHAAAGMAVSGGMALLLVPAIVGWNCDVANRASYVAFGAAWFAAMMAAALGNYPTPIVGYGGSAIIGYALSLLTLPKLVAGRSSAVIGVGEEIEKTLPDRHLRVGLA